MLIDGRKLAQPIQKRIEKDLKLLWKQNTFPKIAIITCGNNYPWKTYVQQKIKFARRLGIEPKIINLSKEDENLLLKAIEKQNNNTDITGVIVQRPLPKTIDRKIITNAISPQKDIDGFRNDSKFQSPVWLAVKNILAYIKRRSQKNLSLSDWLKTKNIVVIGKGETGGRPVMEGLIRLGMDAKTIDSKTAEREKILKKADIIISAVGKSRVVEAKNLKQEVILIGIGAQKGARVKLAGDYEEEEIKNIASFYTPTPGGVGPLNLSYLFKNLILAAKMQK